MRNFVIEVYGAKVRKQIPHKSSFPFVRKSENHEAIFKPNEHKTSIYALQLSTVMGIAFDHATNRPEHIDTILNGLDRYNPETTTVFQDYVTQQCEDRTYDCYANLALLKL